MEARLRGGDNIALRLDRARAEQDLPMRLARLHCKRARHEEQLAAMGIAVKRYNKPTFTRIAPTELKQQMAAEVDLLVEGLAD